MPKRLSLKIRARAAFEAAGLGAAWLRASFTADSDRLFLWSPVLVAAGVGTYFSLGFEPQPWPAAVLLPLALAALWLSRNHPVKALCAGIGFFLLLGFGAAVLRAQMVAAPVLARPMSGPLVAKVVAVESTESGSLSAILEPRSFARLTASETPAKVRISVRLRGAVLRPGAVVTLRARLMPPPEPVQPGGFDYARQAWFDGMGAVGFAYTLPEELSPPSGRDRAVLADLRMRIGERIRSVVGGTSGAVAAALINGERASIPDDVSEDLRAAGIFHVLSISGLHMVLFAGSVFWVVRAALALWPSMALRYPIKKWAAAAALFGATFYLLISGAAIATQRAWIMISLMFLAILLDRPALTMRNVMLAALVILLWRPDSLIGASFQMSFAAVIALIAFYESSWMRSWTSRPRATGLGALPALAGSYVLGIALTSIVAGAATGAIAAYHFNRIALYGLAGNMAAMPLVGIVVMPMALLSLLLMPFGLDGPALWAMGKGVEGMLLVAHEVASWNGADRLVPEAPLGALLLVVLGSLWLALWREKWRFAGIVPMVAGLALWGAASRPDVLIDRDAALFAVRTANGSLALTSSRPAYAAEQWLRHDGDGRRPREASKSEALACDRHGCIYKEEGRPVIAFAGTLDAVVEDCAKADIVIAKISVPYRIRRECDARLLLDYFSFWRNGATALTFTESGGIDVTTSLAARGNRPWVQRRGDQ
ncbi:ComEC/Rec2 family competence protein [Parvibaculum lavamentivorans]|nr:ComEC/Rec2 family competence protein [Parvibaculum lavamentivorans]